MRSFAYQTPAGFFDGVAQHGDCGCGTVLRIDWGIQHHLCLDGGSGSTTKVKAMALWGLLWISLHKNIHYLNIYGDSKALIDGIKGTTGFCSPLLIGWLRRIKHTLDLLLSYTISHVYQECNTMAHSLSKAGLGRSSSILHYRYLVENKVLEKCRQTTQHPTTKL